MCFSCLFDGISLWHVGRVAGECCERTAGRRKGERRGESRGKGRSSELEMCHLLGLACNFPWDQQAPPHPHYLLALFSVTLYLLLIGFNERFNKTALPDQIKLLLSATLNPGSLLCNASAPLPAEFLQTCFRPLHSLWPPPSSCLVSLTSLLTNLQQAETADHTRKVPTGAGAMHSAKVMTWSFLGFFF